MIVYVCCSNCQSSYEITLHKLSPMERELFELIAESNGYMTRRRVVDIVYASHANGGPINADNVISKRINNINLKLGAKVIEHAWGLGYRIAIDNPVKQERE